MYDSVSGDCVKVFKGHSGYVFSICLSEDGCHLFSAGEDKVVKMWNIEHEECV